MGALASHEIGERPLFTIVIVKMVVFDLAPMAPIITRIVLSVHMDKLCREVIV